MRSSITLVVSKGIFGVLYDGQEDFEGSFEFDFIHSFEVCATKNYLLVARHDGLLEFSIGEIFEVSITAEEHIVKYGSYFSREEKNIVFDKCDISRMITVAAITTDGETSRWILSLEGFLPFRSIQNFRVLNEKNVNLYSTCVFLLLDNTYAQNILYNFSNYCIDDVQDYFKEVHIGDVFPDTSISRDKIFTKRKSDSERKEESTTLKMMWNSGDLSFAPDPNSYDYIHRSKDNNNLSLSVINQMTVRTDFVEHFESKFVNTNNFAFTIFSISEIITGPSFMLSTLTAK